MHQLNISQKAFRLSRLAESLAFTSCFTPPPTFGGGGQPHLSGSYLTLGLQTRVHSGAAEVRAIPNTLKTADGAPVSKSGNLSAEVSHAFNQPSLKKKSPFTFWVFELQKTAVSKWIMQNYSTHKKFYPLKKAGTFLFLMMQLRFYKSLNMKKKIN